jgi:hypothetical protein
MPMGGEIAALRRRGREAEGGGLLNRYRVSSPIEGSNPSVSANYVLSPDILAGYPYARCLLAAFWKLCRGARVDGVNNCLEQVNRFCAAARPAAIFSAVMPGGRAGSE